MYITPAGVFGTIYCLLQGITLLLFGKDFQKIYVKRVSRKKFLSLFVKAGESRLFLWNLWICGIASLLLALFILIVMLLGTNTYPT